MQFGIIYLKDFDKIALIEDAPEYKQGSLRGKRLTLLVALQKRGCREERQPRRETPEGVSQVSLTFCDPRSQGRCRNPRLI